MFSEFSTLVMRSSACIDYLNVNPFTGVVNAMFKSGHSYNYTNVSRRAIINLMCNPNMSLGFWTNDNCINSVRTNERYRFHRGYSVA